MLNRTAYDLSFFQTRNHRVRRDLIARRKLARFYTRHGLELAA